MPSFAARGTWERATTLSYLTTTLEIATTSVALLPIGGGTVLFRWCEPSTARERALHTDGAAPEGGRLTNTLLPTVNEEARQ